ncbi:hypothetical protein SAMN04487941_2611 [Pontibacter akesuensis]|uniref:Uncharacterized protein n=1 Tax=Pontibacter akesuensis TaxID=388950 RepID=A0A1I7J9E0_9BACT|nr:hypothetical protein SAMN04487941_2611 [Pontibacter akesuensis]
MKSKDNEIKQQCHKTAYLWAHNPSVSNRVNKKHSNTVAVL